MPSRIDNLDHCAHKAFTSCDCKATSSHGGFSAFSSSLLTMKPISGSLLCASFNPCFVHGNTVSGMTCCDVLSLFCSALKFSDDVFLAYDRLLATLASSQ